MLFFCLFQCFEEKEYQTESKRNETFGNVIFGTNVIHRTWSGCQETNEESTRQGVRLPPGRALHPRGPSIAPPTYFFLVYISTYPPKHLGAPRKPNSIAATFCAREIPSWDLFRSSTGGGLDHGGPLHQLHGLYDDV